MAKSEFKKRSLINLRGYIIDKNERKIKKENIVLQLTEKEINSTLARIDVTHTHYFWLHFLGLLSKFGQSLMSQNNTSQN